MVCKGKTGALEVAGVKAGPGNVTRRHPKGQGAAGMREATAFDFGFWMNMPGRQRACDGDSPMDENDSPRVNPKFA